MYMYIAVTCGDKTAEIVRYRKSDPFINRDETYAKKKKTFKLIMAEPHPRTMLITKRVFCMLMRKAAVDEEVLQFFEIDLGSISETERTIVKKVSDSVCEVINSSDQANVECSVQDFKRRQWHIHSTNVHMEFTKVVAMIFKNEATFRNGASFVDEGNCNWGRVISFLAFAASYAVYIHRIGMPSATVESIHGWTVQVLEHSIKKFFNEHGRWVSAVMIIIGYVEGRFLVG